MLRQSGCGSNPGDQTVGARRTRGGLGSPDWLEQQTSEERPALPFCGRLKTRTLAFTQQISRTPTVRYGWLDGCCERNGVRARGRAPYQEGPITADNKKGDSGVKQGLLFRCS